MVRTFVLSLVVLAGLSLPMFGQDSDAHDENLDIRSPIGNLHVGDDADAKKIGLPLYPGARLKTDDDNNSNQANLSLLTESFGMKLVVANYVSNAAPAKIIDFYRGKLKRYGKVLECHSDKHGGDVNVHDNDGKDSGQSKALKCDDNSGPVTELKVGTEDDQHIVSVEPSGTNGETKFALVYVRTRGKSGEI
ncbi:MAG: hypothetical protein WAM79_04260 [Candidatus Sulfotelmatobacter sp.]